LSLANLWIRPPVELREASGLRRADRRLGSPKDPKTQRPRRLAAALLHR